jgi:outer membrane protein assembly factor BamB
VTRPLSFVQAWDFFARALFLALMLAGCTLSAQLWWPQFRGPGGSGVAERGEFPVDFGPSSNLVWKTPLPVGHSSPIIWGGRIFLTGVTNEELATLCLDRATGHVLWQRTIRPDKLERGSHHSSPAASTPATDGTIVVVYFGAFGLHCYDFAGSNLWQKPLPVPITQHGASTSPVLANDKVILAVDQDVDSYLLAVHKGTGQTVWKADRPGFRRGFSTPLVWPASEPEIAVLSGTLRLAAYDLRTGAERWTVRGLPNEMVASPTAGDGQIYAAGWTHGSGVARMPSFDTLLEQGDESKDAKLTREEAPAGPARNHFQYIDADKDGRLTREEWESMARIFDEARNVALAVRPGGRGEVTDTHVVWRQTRGLPYVPTPLCYEGRLYLVKNGGLATCLDAKTGRPFYQEERLGALGDYYTSPVAGGGRVCVASQPGLVVVFRAGDSLEVLARNNLGEPIMATPAIVEDTLYVRTKNHLYAFRETPRPR